MAPSHAITARKNDFNAYRHRAEDPISSSNGSLEMLGLGVFGERGSMEKWGLAILRVLRPPWRRPPRPHSIRPLIFSICAPLTQVRAAVASAFPLLGYRDLQKSLVFARDNSACMTLPSHKPVPPPWLGKGVKRWLELPSRMVPQLGCHCQCIMSCDNSDHRWARDPLAKTSMSTSTI